MVFYCFDEKKEANETCEDISLILLRHIETFWFRI